MKTKFFLPLLLLCLGISSCDKEGEEIDDWPPMKWKTVPEIRLSDEILYYAVGIPAEGAEYTFTCTNYRLTKVAVLDENNSVFKEITYEHPYFENDWMSITEENGNSIKIVARPNPTANSHKLFIEASGGNVSTHFLLIQEAGEQ